VGTAQQLGLDGMPTRLFVCTPTRLTTWLDCPRRYRLTYLERPAPPKGPPWAHNSLGASVHSALAAWYRLPAAERTPGRAAAVLDEVWLTDGFRDAHQAETMRGRAREMVQRYAAGVDPHEEPVGIERTVAMRTDVLALSGRIDRLDQREIDGVQQLVVVDYKTGRHVLTTSDARSSLALAVYAAAAARVLRLPCTRVELHHLPSGEVVSHEHTPEALARHLSRAEGIAREAAAADVAFRAGLEGDEVDRVFPAVVSSQCRWCDFSRHCPEGSSAFPPAASWSAVVDGA
jgi:putative RecB family exonuclease